MTFRDHHQRRVQFVDRVHVRVDGVPYSILRPKHETEYSLNVRCSVASNGMCDVSLHMQWCRLRLAIAFWLKSLTLFLCELLLIFAV